MNVLKVPEILLPKSDVDKTKWSVIACDQFTSQPKYWETLKNYCGTVSTLNIIFPEIYLGENEDERINKINVTMNDYLSRGVFDSIKGFILSVRKTCYGRRRVGIIAAVDLEEYSINEKKAIRPTERIVPERLPIRIKIRKDAPLELPHALLLFDDNDRSVIEPLYEKRSELKKLYSFDLNMNGGSLEGYLIDDPVSVMEAIERVTSSRKTVEKYGCADPFVFAVGDGNHSIATAKACWEELKPSLSESERETHPSRYCLVEIVNLYDDDLNFEPIHRIIFGADDKLVKKLCTSLNGKCETEVYFGEKKTIINIPESSAFAITEIQKVLDEYVYENPNCRQDYIHGRDNLLTLAKQGKSVAVVMPTLRKADLFSYVATHGVLTRKAFSMGEAEEKRYYYECRKIK